MLSILEYVSIFSVLPPCIMVFISWKKLENPLKMISVLILFTLIMEGLGFVFFQLGINNLWLFHLFTWIEAFLFFAYLYLLVRDRDYRMIFLTGIVLFFGASVYLFFWVENLRLYNSVQRSIGSLWACLMCFIYFYNLLKETRIKNLKRFPHYWMVSAFLLYFAGMFFVNLMQNYNLFKKVFGFDIYLIHSGLNIMLNVGYVFVLFLGMREKEEHYSIQTNDSVIDNFG